MSELNVDNLSGNISEAGDCNREKKMTLPNLAKYRDQKAAGCVYLQFSKDHGRGIRLSEKQNQVIYGIGYSDEVLQGIREGKVEGVMAYSMYSFGFMQ